MIEAEGILRRYTQLPSLFYMLAEKKLTLLDPSSWDDKNDSYFLAQYKLKCNLKTVLALCFSTATETYHHWNIFSGGSAGVCIQFKRDELLGAIRGCEGLRYGEVNYILLNTAQSRKLTVEELPFAKRYPFQDEREWRVVYESRTHEKSNHDVPIPLSSISRINLSPWLPESLKEHVKKTLREIEDCSELDISRSTLISNERWKKMGEEAT
jgi:hypothetical protein